MLEAGRLRHFVTIQTPQRDRNAETGEFTTTWNDMHSDIDAAIEDQSVKGFLQSQTDQTDVSTMIVIRYIPGLDATVRFVGVCGCHLGKIYNPVGQLADKDSGVEYLTFPCSQGINDG